MAVPHDPAQRPDLHPVNRATIFFGQTGGCPVSQSYAIGLKKENRTEHSAIVLLNIGTQSVQCLREWILGHDHGQYPVIGRRRAWGCTWWLGD
jgi:hypothetical protein